MDATGNLGSAALQLLDLLQEVAEQGLHLEHITVFNNMLWTQRGALVAPASPAA